MEPEMKVSKAAQELAKLGAEKGGQARANVLTPDERSEIARRAVMVRWEKAGKLKKSSESAISSPVAVEEKTEPPPFPYSMFRGTLKLGTVELECHVLNDLRRVFTQREVVRVLSGGRESGDLNQYLERNPLTRSKLPLGTIRFKIPAVATEAIGYEATLLVEICEAYLEARERKLLKTSQCGLAKHAEIVVRACAKVGIIALVDEATGYQQVRAKQALQLKLQAFIADELQEWARMFPQEFWIHLARLEGVHYSPRHRPLRWGRYIMAFVYDAIDPDVGRELRKKNPNPHFLQNHHQWLKKFGREKVGEQIASVTTIMKLCKDMDDFRQKFKRVFDRQMTFEFFEVGAT